MRLCYQVATPDVAVAPSVTAYQGSLEHSFSKLAEYGYDGAELMTLDPGKLNWNEVKASAAKHGLSIALVCTGEVFGQLGISFTDPDEKVRARAVARVKEIIDFAAFLDANINIGRVRGQYRHDVPRETTEEWAAEAFREISLYAKPKAVDIALETVTIMQTNFVNTLAEAASFADRVGCGNFKVMMDVFHLNLEEKNLLAAIREYSGYNIHVHLSDNNRRYPGQCGLDFAAIIRAFYDTGYDGAFCTEIYQIPDQDGAARGAIAHLAPIFHDIYGRPL